MTTPMRIPYQPTNPVILSEARSAQSKDPEEATPATSARPFLTQMPGPHALTDPAITGAHGAR